MDARSVIAELRRRADPSRRPWMARVGIDVSKALGVSVPDIRAVAKRCGTDRILALQLWRTGIHEARILATLVADPGALTTDEMEGWVRDISSWDVCDFAADLFSRTPTGPGMIAVWAGRPERIREALRVLDDRETGRVGEGGTRPRVHRISAPDPARVRRSEERGEERHLLGASTDRETGSPVARRGDR